MPAKEYNRESIPSPEEMLTDAIEETEDPLVALSEYAETIILLRKRGYSWEKTEEFFNERGIEATRHDLFYVAKKEINRRRAESFKYNEDELVCTEDDSD